MTRSDPLSSTGKRHPIFHLVSTRQFRFPDSRLPSPAAPHVLGIARRPPESRPEGRHRTD